MIDSKYGRLYTEQEMLDVVMHFSPAPYGLPGERLHHIRKIAGRTNTKIGEEEPVFVLRARRLCA